MQNRKDHTIEEVDDYAIVADFYDYLMRHVNYQKWFRFVSTTLQKRDIKSGPLLEVACGTGTMLAQFCAAGWEVVGIDKSAAMLQRAKRKLPPDIGENALILADMRTAKQYGNFRAVICLYDSINYCLNENELAAALENMLDNLSSGGLLIFDICTIYNCRHNFRDFYEREYYRDLDYTREAFFNPANNRQTNEFWITNSVDETLIYHEKHVQQMFRIAVVKSVLLDKVGGCEVLGIYENYTHRPGSEKSERVHFVVRKR